MRSQSLVVLCLVSAGLLVPPMPAAAASYIECSSNDYRRDFCSVDTRGGVSLDRDYARDTPCIEGRTWGTNNDGGQRGIWVDKGCRGSFKIGDRSSSRSNDTAAAVGGLILGGLILGALSNHHHHDDDSRNRPDDRPGYRPWDRPDSRPALADGAIDQCSGEARYQSREYGNRPRVDRIVDQYPAGNRYHVEGYVTVEANGAPYSIAFHCDWDGRRAQVSF